MDSAVLAGEVAAILALGSACVSIDAVVRAVVAPKLELGMIMVTWLDDRFLKAARSFLIDLGAPASAADDVRNEAGVCVGMSIRAGNQYRPGV